MTTQHFKSTVPAPPSASEDRADEIIGALAPLLAHHRHRWAARCQAHGVSIVGFQVLALLEMHGGLPMSRLAEELDVALPNATGIVGRLVDRGIVQRTHDDSDRRLVLVTLTDAGQRLIGEMEAGRRERMSRLIAQLDDQQQRRLLQSVKDLHAAALRLAAEPGESTTA
ncbi:MAG TPA: MarR family transcriptional regulator [Candidatus Limnocylindria bacterium]|nr:MarR family transcriptional regulator [Candidatus Limnocylindria bacterium]